MVVSRLNPTEAGDSKPIEDCAVRASPLPFLYAVYRSWLVEKSETRDLVSNRDASLAVPFMVEFSVSEEQAPHMNPRDFDFLSETDTTATTRRQFLQQTVGLAAGAAALSGLPPRAESASSGKPLLPTVKLGPQQ